MMLLFAAVVARGATNYLLLVQLVTKMIEVSRLELLSVLAYQHQETRVAKAREACHTNTTLLRPPSTKQ